MNDQDLDFETLYRRYAADVFRFALYVSGRQDHPENMPTAHLDRKPLPLSVATSSGFARHCSSCPKQIGRC